MALVDWQDEMASMGHSEREVYVEYSVWVDAGPSAVATAFSPSKEVKVERDIMVHRSEIEDAFEGRIVPKVLEEIGAPDPERAARKFVSQVRKLAKADGLRLSDEEALALANIMFLVGRKLADELE